ncbi:MAG: ATP-binding protein, partial [Bifidobacteriales bacterium]|nr:ATP-binding protein [Bifidobacteriales bacterium]
MSEIQDYIDHPNETLHVEYKRWLDLSIPENRANLARHIAAIANHGGGFIIFGFEDNTLASSGPNPFGFGYNRDSIASIIKKYLDPAVHCDVHQVSDGKDSHSVIVVPSHGAIPICAKANGPIVDGKTKGITTGTYYIRKAGPESAPIITSSDWYDLIRRCVLHDRTALLGALGAALVPQRERKADADRLLLWHTAASAAYQNSVTENKLGSDLYKKSSQYSYLVQTTDHEHLPKGSLKETLRQVNAEMRDRVNTGWSLFFPFDRKPIDPYFITDHTVGDDHQFLEANLL